MVICMGKVTHPLILVEMSELPILNHILIREQERTNRLAYSKTNKSDISGDAKHP